MIRLERMVKYGVILLIYTGLLLFGITYFLSELINYNQILVLSNLKTFFILIGFVLILIAIFSVLYAYIDRMIEKNISERLQWIAVGNYRHPIFEVDTLNILEMKFSVDGYRHAIDTIRQKIVLLNQEVQEMSALRRVVDNDETKEEILEAERHRIARELHDSVSQQLFASMMMLAALTENSNVERDVIIKQLKTIEKVINEAQVEMRALLLHLRPVNLEGRSLKEGILNLLKELDSKISLNIHWELDDVSLIPGNEDNLFRMTQEILSNTLRHAHADHLELYLKETDNNISLRIADDGVGFEPELEKHGNYGLINIKERVDSMGGQLNIVSFKGQGTTIDVRIPKI
ncbi:sensor histidine kinase [Atopobacter phocae]|uniref:sensor histidine kinase n=1 Tax=Atopobacter phocae TaxID=136492 RepID=UPI0004B471E5|nr:sensor histidine kinase [Atopobacter phocae]